MSRDRLRVSLTPCPPLHIRGEGGRKAGIVASLLLVGLITNCKPAPAPPAAPSSTATLSSTDKARNFVLEFYGWYTAPNATKNIDSAMALRRTSFAPDLAAMIDADNACAIRTHGECNLEEDPILASQDPCQSYEVGGALLHGDTVGVSVFGVCDGKRDTVPAVIAMVTSRDSAWQFVNFVYPVEHSDLRAILSKKPGK